LVLEGIRVAASDLCSIVFLIGVGVLCIAWWRRPDAGNSHNLEG
jgi:hypothetical protein